MHPPGSDDFESTAVGWLLDVVPPDYRLHGVLRRYPVALATMARYHSKACVEGAREGYRTARTELADALPPHAVDTVLAAYRKEGARLAAVARAVDLVERALRGEVFPPGMGAPPTAERRPAPPKTAQPRPAEARQGEPRQAESKSAGSKTGAPRAVSPKTAGLKTGDAKPDADTARADPGRAGAARAGTGRADATRATVRAGAGRAGGARRDLGEQQEPERHRPARQRKR